MESVTILRALSRRRLLLALGLLLVLCVDLLGSYRVSILPPALHSATSRSGFASQRVLVNTPSSLIADARAKGATSIVIRATILADLIESDDVRSAIAREAGVRPEAVGTIASTTASPQTESPLAKQVLEVTRPAEPYVVSVGLQAGQPILSIQAIAPGARDAGRLVQATTAALTAAGRRAALARGPVAVEPVGSVQSGVEEAGGGKKKAALAALAILVLWCAALVGADGLARRRGAAAGASFPGGISLPR